MEITLNRLNDAVHFEAVNEDGISMHLDGTPEIGGVDGGVRPYASSAYGDGRL